MTFAPYIPPPPAATLPEPANDDVRASVGNQCRICGDAASVGVGIFPLRGMSGDWYCEEHAPATEKRAAPPVEMLNKRPLEIQPRGDKSHILRIENMVTGVVSEIDLRAPAKKGQRKSNANKIEWRRREEVEANLSPDVLDEIFDVLKLQEYADARNREAVRAGSTDRYCRCGALAQTAWRVKGNAELWRCDECI